MIKEELKREWPLVLILVLSVALFVTVMSMSACSEQATKHESNEATLYRQIISQCSVVIDSNKAEIENQALQLKLCNDLNTSLMQNNALLQKGKAPKKKAKPRAYKGDPYQEEKS